MSSRALCIGLLCAALAARAPAQSSVAQTPAAAMPRPFAASYDLEWRGMTAGTSTLELVRVGGDDYIFRSRNLARGVFRIAFPDAITQTSTFTMSNGQVQPTTYHADDGSDKTDKDVELKFDWKAMQASGTAEKKPVSLTLIEGVQDPLSVQVALMMDLAAGHTPTKFVLLDKDEIKEYQYVREGTLTLDTPLGKLDTVIYASHRPNSTRITRMWLAPTLGYLPVRAEQTRDGRREFALSLRAANRN